MRDLARIAEQLRAARHAQHQFVMKWVVEETLVLPALDRMFADLGRISHRRDETGSGDAGGRRE